MIALKKKGTQGMGKKQKVKKSLKSKVQKGWKKIGLGAVGLIVGLPVLVLGVYQIAYKDRVFPGVIVAGAKVGNKTGEEAKEIIQQEVRSVWDEEPAVTMRSNGSEWYILLADIEVNYQIEESAQSALGVGRSGQGWDDIKTRWHAWRKGVRLPLEVSSNQEALNARAASIAAELNIPMVPPSIVVLDREMPDGTWTLVELGESGQVVNQEKLVDEVNFRLAWLDKSLVKVPVKKIGITVTEEQLKQTKARAEKLINKTLNLSTEEQGWSLTSESLVGFLNFEGGFNQEAIDAYVETLAEGIDRPPQDAAFQYVGGRVTEFRPAQDGWQIDKSVTAGILMRKLEEMEQSEDNNNFAARLELGKTSPTISLAEVNGLGIKELIGKGLSTYRGSIVNRVHNVGLSANRINGVLVPPGEEFSFNASVGEISDVTGYKSAWIIKGNATVLDDGGGVCQTSTTTFRAALDAGLPITQRRAHSYRVGYYEQNAKAGLDATIYSPSVDLKFLNDTPGHILVQTVVNSGSRQLTVEIYGTSDGRKSQILNHRVWDVVPAPPPRYQDDPSLPAGTVKQIDYSAAGAKAKFDYVVTRGGEIIHSRSFYSNFRPWQAVYLRGV